MLIQIRFCARIEQISKTYENLYRKDNLTTNLKNNELESPGRNPAGRGCEALSEDNKKISSDTMSCREKDPDFNTLFRSNQAIKIR